MRLMALLLPLAAVSSALPASAAANPEPHVPGGQNSAAIQAFSDELSVDPRTARSWNDAHGLAYQLSPECPSRDVSNGHVLNCTAVYKSRASEYTAYATVSPAQIARDKAGLSNTATIYPPTHWSTRRRTCTHISIHGLTVPGVLTGNTPGCSAYMLWQYFDNGGHIVYTFKRHLTELGTGSGLTPDFTYYSCGWSHKTYQCSTRVGDEFRWQPFS
jgi:hypothetical protein